MMIDDEPDTFPEDSLDRILSDALDPDEVERLVAARREAARQGE